MQMQFLFSVSSALTQNRYNFESTDHSSSSSSGVEEDNQALTRALPAATLESVAAADAAAS